MRSRAATAEGGELGCAGSLLLNRRLCGQRLYCEGLVAWFGAAASPHTDSNVGALRHWWRCCTLLATASPFCRSLLKPSHSFEFAHTSVWEEVRLMLFSESWKPLNWQMYSKYVFIRVWFCSEGCYRERVPSNRNLACLEQMGPGGVWKGWVLPEVKLPLLRVADQEKCLLLDHQALSQRGATAQALLFTFQKTQSDKWLIHRTMDGKPTGT